LTTTSLISDAGSRYRFFLGGYDLEMITIRDLLIAHCGVDAVYDRRLSWGASTSDYSAELTEIVRTDRIAVLIELTPNSPLPESAIVIDHHNELAGKETPTSLEQVFALLNLPASAWTREMMLIAVNDRGHIQAMEAVGASSDEIRSIRAADRRAQGITAEEERQAAIAVSQASVLANGRLTILRMPQGRTSAAADAMEPALGGPGYKNLLICTPETSNFFGTGSLVNLLQSEFPNGWYGGQLPVRGFWGCTIPCELVQDVLLRSLEQSESA
jgi:hypothetical protein